jgi:hypothetical protein
VSNGYNEYEDALRLPDDEGDRLPNPEGPRYAGVLAACRQLRADVAAVVRLREEGGRLTL